MNVSQHDRACIVANKKSEFPKLTNPVRPLREFLHLYLCSHNQ